jgi:hypothetical protein
VLSSWRVHCNERVEGNIAMAKCMKPGAESILAARALAVQNPPAVSWSSACQICIASNKGREAAAAAGWVDVLALKQHEK